MRLPFGKKKPQEVQQLTGKLDNGQPINMNFVQAPEQKAQKTVLDDIHEMLEQDVSFDDAFRFVQGKWGIKYVPFHKAWYKMKQEEKKSGWFV